MTAVNYHAGYEIASAVEPGYALRTRFTTVDELPYPAGAVVSLAPKTWTLGQLDCRSSNAANGDAPQWARRRVTAAAKTLCMVKDVDMKGKMLMRADYLTRENAR